MLLLKLNIGCECFYLCRLFTIDLFKPENVTLYFLVGVASEARVEKIAKNIEFLNMKRNLVLKYNIFLYSLVEDVPAN